jgi:hypothetical protein
MMRDMDRHTEDRLQAERPVPRPAFRGALGRRLAAMRAAGVGHPRHLKALVAAYAGSGFLLLAIALAGVLGGGPLAAG